MDVSTVLHSTTEKPAWSIPLAISPLLNGKYFPMTPQNQGRGLGGFMAHSFGQAYKHTTWGKGLMCFLKKIDKVFSGKIECSTGPDQVISFPQKIFHVITTHNSNLILHLIFRDKFFGHFYHFRLIKDDPAHAWMPGHHGNAKQTRPSPPDPAFF